ncbi:MAG: c-type cytochrome [Roseiarcus sp.]
MTRGDGRWIVAAATFCLLTLPVAAQQAPPPWAYPVLAPGVKPPPDDGLEKTVPGSKTSFTRKQISDLFNAPDWFPEDHPPMPDVVAHGRGPEVRPCGMCHLPNGQGRPENAPLAGLSATYIAQQIAAFQSGRRRSAVPTTRPQTFMVETAKHAGDEDVKVAAAYFSKLTYRPWVRVIEAETVPKTEVIFGTLWAPASGTETEPLGHRIVEIPENLERTELRDPRSGFVAYVPVGSLAQGEKLATTGGDGKTIPCATCHGPGLKGLGAVPPIAGRSTSYIVRQIYDIQSGARAGSASLLMRPVVAKLTTDDMISIAAYVASLAP